MSCDNKNVLKMDDPKTGGQICAFLAMKLDLLRRHLSITEKMKAAFESNDARNIRGLIAGRQGCINKMEKIDLAINKMVRPDSDKRTQVVAKFKGLIESHLKNITDMMETIASLDRELLMTVSQERECIKTELLHKRHVRQAAQGYGAGNRYAARFLDTRR